MKDSLEDEIENILLENRLDGIDINATVTELVTTIKSYLDEQEENSNHIPVGSILGLIEIDNQLYEIELRGKPVGEQRAKELSSK
jgi:hypothetical protein